MRLKKVGFLSIVALTAQSLFNHDTKGNTFTILLACVQWMVAGGYVKRDYTDSDNERKHPQNITATSVPLSILDLSTSGSQSLTLTYTHEYITPSQRGMYRYWYNSCCV